MENIDVNIKGIRLSLASHPTLFSPKRVDAGTLAMLKCVEFSAGDRVLDLGCGCGVVGIYAAKFSGEENVFMLDNDLTAVEIAKANAVANGVPQIQTLQSDGFRSFRENEFTKILSNPPYHADFSVPKHFILKGFNRLAIGGEMWMVTKREKWYRNKLGAVFGGVETHRVDSYVVFRAVKKRTSYARKS
ncbi:class I SAM-dependent methyltransferase [Fuerstiella marisgermanici]|uniref:Ribosomal RNA large subunit methyltransferase G n=1 Tax=Fuerstiella marisgermanici TaxID=1891926 RepID=A0A1P8WS71_9PLAN|nr:methyltransferase [Fuerstiella marisgermanici]APZ96910.1 Ribosomal RNA large subunit methyltransferase G [Fuerstiella marisgermanici]